MVLKYKSLTFRSQCSFLNVTRNASFLPTVDKEVATNLSESQFSLLQNGDNNKPYLTYNIVNAL